MNRVDVVIISDAKTPYLKAVTESALMSLFRSEVHTEFFAYVVESADVNYSHIHPNVRMLAPSPPFGYHKYLNIGRKSGNSEYVCLCNNDLLFFPDWANNIIKAMREDPDLLSSSPISYDPHIARHNILKVGIEFGYKIGKAIGGWCIFQRRNLYDLIGDLDEQFVFYYCDNDYAMTLRENGLKHALVRNSRVDHLNATTYKTTSRSIQNLYYDVQKTLFIEKWGERL